MKVVVTEPLPGAARVAFERAAVTPEGNPDHARVTALLNAPVTVRVALAVAVFPAVRLRVL